LNELEFNILENADEAKEIRPPYILCESLSDINFEIDWKTKIYCSQFPKSSELNTSHGIFYGGTLDLDILNFTCGRGYLERAFALPSEFAVTNDEEGEFFRWSCAHLLSYGLYTDQVLIE